MKTQPVIRRVPIAYLTAIGRIVTRWALLEWKFTNIAYLLLNLDPKSGRVAVREPRIDDYLSMLEQLIDLRGLKVPPQMASLRKLLPSLESNRDLFAHGIWVRDPETKQIYIRRIKGSWRPDPTKPKVSRRIKPEAVKLIPRDVGRVHHGIDLAIHLTEQLDVQIRRTIAKVHAKENVHQKPRGTAR